MARNYSNTQYETFEKANEAAKRRAEAQGISDDEVAVYPHWDKGGKVKTWRISTHETFVERWSKNRCNRPVRVGTFQVRRTTVIRPATQPGCD